MYTIQIGSFVTLARYVGQGAFGVLGGTSCQVVDIVPPAKPELPTVLVLRPLSAGQLGAICVRVPAEDTLEGLLNILEAKSNGLQDDLLTMLQGLDTIDPTVAKAVIEFALLKMSTTGRDLTLKRPDKAPAGEEVKAP